MTVLDTPALRATSSTAKSGPASRTASTAAATRSSRRARRCSVHRARRPSSAGGGAWTCSPTGRAPGGSATRCMCFTVTATFHHSRTRRLGESTVTATLPTTMPTQSTGQSTKKPVDRQALSSRLLGSAAKKSYDPVVDIDWTASIPEDLFGLSPEWSTLYGTPMWASLTHEQRVILTIHEYCSISGGGIWFECLLMQLVLKDIYGEDPAQPHVQWALTEIADECRHSVMFARTAEKFGAPSYHPPASILRLGKAFVARADGPAAYAAILVAEEILDIFQRDLMKDERVQPLTRATSQIHVVEEARHMRFAREEIARRTPELSRWQLRRHRSVLAAVAAIVVDNLVQPGVYASVGLDPEEARTAARGNEHYAAKLRAASTGLVTFLRDAGLIGAPSEALWRRPRLI